MKAILHSRFGHSLFQTSISERFSKGAFNRDYNQTLGIDYYLKRINLTRKFQRNFHSDYFSFIQVPTTSH